MTGLLASDALAILCGLAALAGFVSWRRPGRALELAGRALGAAAAVAAAGLWIARWRSAGHLPLFGTYEASLSLAAAVTMVAVLRELRAPRGWLVPPAAAVAAGLLLHGGRFDATPYALTISERSLVVDAHAFVAWFAFAALTSNAALAGATLLHRTGGAAAAWVGRSLSWGFLLHSGMLVTGSLYELLLFGRVWSFDPIETLGLMMWLAYGALLHMHLMGGWDGRRLAPWCLGLFLLLVVSYRLIVHLPPESTYHIFDMDLRIHVMGPEGEP